MPKEWIINQANMRCGITKKNKVGAVSELIRKHSPKSVEDWERYYYENVYPKRHLEELGGRLMLSFLPGIDFAYKNSDYFLTHDTAPIPRELVMRFGDLSGATFINGTIEAMNFMQERLRNVERYHCGMVDGLMDSIVPMVVKRAKSGVVFRAILPETYRAKVSAIVNEYRTLDANIPPHAIEVRTLPTIPICGAVTDRGCRFKLPFTDGSMDHSTMVVGDDPVFCRWCRDLYAHYWARAEPV